MPREPMRLLDFIKKSGGIKDDRGDIATIIGGDSKAARSLFRKTGQSLDEITRAAWDAGYFPESRERPGVEAMLEKIEQDYGGEPVYSEHDAEAVDAFRGALSRNREIDELASRLGIDTKGLGSKEFWSQVSERMSFEDLARDHASHAAAFEEQFREAERAAQEYLESRGEAWEPDILYGDAAKPRTLEDFGT